MMSNTTNDDDHDEEDEEDWFFSNNFLLNDDDSNDDNDDDDNDCQQHADDEYKIVHDTNILSDILKTIATLDGHGHIQILTQANDDVQEKECCYLYCNDEDNDEKNNKRDNDNDNILQLRRTLHHCQKLIKSNMGTLKLCQFQRGTLLRQCGAIPALLCALCQLEPAAHNSTKMLTNIHHHDDLQMDILDFCTASWAALRDLACGDIHNRTSMRTTSIIIIENNQNENDTSNNNYCITGLELLTRCIARHNDSINMMNKQDDDSLSQEKQLSHLTALLGLVRNLTHRTKENAKWLHRAGMTDLLATQLIATTSQDDNNNGLPDIDTPWREACYRCAHSLLNMAEAYPPCAQYLATSSQYKTTIIPYLYKEWGTNKNSHRPSRRWAPLFDVLMSERSNYCSGVEK